MEAERMPVGFHVCSRCNGEKVVHAVIQPTGEPYTATCPVCGGSGIEEDEFPEEPER